MKTFDIITEADARVLHARRDGDAVARGGHITPLALDTLRERAVTVVREGSASPRTLRWSRPPNPDAWPSPATIPASRCAAI